MSANKGNKIGVTGAGGGVGQSIIKSLYDTDYNITSMDSDYMVTGLHAVDSAYVLPLANSYEYIPKLLKICKREKLAYYSQSSILNYQFFLNTGKNLKVIINV